MEVLFLLILLGLAIGSFVSVITYRIPKSEGFVFGRSYCDNCKKELRWIDNIPLFSFLLYKGKSRCCHKKISPRYPLIELSTAAGFVGLYIAFGFSFLHSAYYMLLVLTLSIFVIDFEHQIIPDELTWSILPISIYISSGLLFANLFAGLLVSFLLLTLYLITRGQGIGLGDVKLAIPLALFLGLEKGLYWIVFSFILGGAVALILIILKKANLKTKIAFGPFMLLAFWMFVFFSSYFFK